MIQYKYSQVEVGTNKQCLNECQSCYDVGPHSYCTGFIILLASLLINLLRCIFLEGAEVHHHHSLYSWSALRTKLLTLRTQWNWWQADDEYRECTTINYDLLTSLLTCTSTCTPTRFPVCWGTGIPAFSQIPWELRFLIPPANLQGVNLPGTSTTY